MSARDEDTPSIREIAELTARLRRLSAAGRDADPNEREAFLADKDALIARIENAAGHRPDTADDAETDTAGWTGEPQDAERAATDDDGEEWSR